MDRRHRRARPRPGLPRRAQLHRRSGWPAPSRPAAASSTPPRHGRDRRPDQRRRRRRARWSPAPGRSPTCPSASGSGSPPAPRPPRSRPTPTGSSWARRWCAASPRPTTSPAGLDRARARWSPSWPRASGAGADRGALRRPRPPADVVGLLARLVLGGVILVAGALKVGHPATSARAVRAYQLLPVRRRRRTSATRLPILEVAVGAAAGARACSPGRRRRRRPAHGRLHRRDHLGVGPWADHRLRLLRQGGNYRGRPDAVPAGDRPRRRAAACARPGSSSRPRTAFSLDRTLFACTSTTSRVHA